MNAENTIPERDSSKPTNAGARQAKGKSNMPDAVLRKGLQPKPEPIRLAEESKAAARTAIDKQLRSDGIDGTSSSPKKRTDSYGVGAKSIADANALKK